MVQKEFRKPRKLDCPFSAQRTSISAIVPTWGCPRRRLARPEWRSSARRSAPSSKSRWRQSRTFDVQTAEQRTTGAPLIRDEPRTGPGDFRIPVGLLRIRLKHAQIELSIQPQFDSQPLPLHPRLTSFRTKLFPRNWSLAFWGDRIWVDSSGFREGAWLSISRVGGPNPVRYPCASASRSRPARSRMVSWRP